ncbi:GntR family transcriptional regulator [Halobacillus sp. A1]|uniref:GntR family transcriptional regulator n=1 Tax=Halobacillus sp. A1 TaxID=2880262 RepID=UPI0020A6AFBB|nr:GntR family transcriptional regulator [Halobacillus sp. A1]MCP3031613.1 GntR family transcriptional regulator [Halobacillus sp. A1]
MTEKQRKLPLYVQIRNKMVQNIQDGVWQPGEAIPSESQLIEQYNVSRTTVRQSIRDLVQKGVLVTKRGAPTKVRQTPSEEMENPGVFHHELGADLGVKVIRSEALNDHFFAQNQLELTDEEEVYVFERVRTAEGNPIACQQSFFPMSIAHKLKDEAAETFDFITFLGRHNIHYTNIKEQVTASNATAYEADLLGITPGEALIEIRRKTLGGDNLPIEYSRTKYIPSSFSYRVEIGK